jgi:L-threonylcarbamoyladenylate synthase
MTSQHPEAATIEHAAQALRAGELVVMPTETVYGLAADASSRLAVSEVYRLKGRPADHPLIVHVKGQRQAEFWSALNPWAQALMQAFWPGPLTFILPLRPGVPTFACGGQSTIGLRAPSHPVAQRLLEAFHALGGHGIAAPSANRFGRISPTRPEHVLDDLGHDTPLVLDGGQSAIGLESTIVDLSRSRPVLLRPGGISIAQLEEVLRVPIEVSRNVQEVSQVDTDAPRASGTLEAHYAPRTPLRLVASPAFNQSLEELSRQGVKAMALRLHADPATYGAELYASLRELDQRGADLIVVEAPPGDPAWMAVLDRLRRAAAAHAGTFKT